MIIEATGATIKSINAPGMTVDIKRPEFIAYFLYAILFYVIFRFWQLAKHTHMSHGQTSNRYLNKRKTIIKIANAAMNAEEEEDYHVSDDNPLVVRKLFSRELMISGFNKGGRGFKKGPLNISYWRIFIPELIDDIRAVHVHKDFIEYTFPILYACFILILKGILLLRV